MSETRVTISNIRILVQPDNYGRLQDAPGESVGNAKEFDVTSLNRARIFFSLEAEGSSRGSWDLELIVGLRAGFVQARALGGGTTDFVEALQLLVTLLTHPTEGGHANLVGNQPAMLALDGPTNLLHRIAIHKGMVLMLAHSGDRLLGVFHDIRDFCPLTLSWG